MSKLTDEQRREIDRRLWINVHEGYICPECGYDFVFEVDGDNYVVNNVEYPIYTGQGCCYDTQYWTEDHMCPKCKIPVRYSDST